MSKLTKRDKEDFELVFMNVIKVGKHFINMFMICEAYKIS